MFDIIKESEIFAKRYVGKPEGAVAIAHRFSDDLMERLTGKKGVFSTKIAFVSDVTGSKEIYVSDYDGRNAKRVTGNSSINLSPVVARRRTHHLHLLQNRTSLRLRERLADRRCFRHIGQAGK